MHSCQYRSRQGPLNVLSEGHVGSSQGHRRGPYRQPKRLAQDFGNGDRVHYRILRSIWTTSQLRIEGLFDTSSL